MWDSRPEVAYEGAARDKLRDQPKTIQNPEKEHQQLDWRDQLGSKNVEERSDEIVDGYQRDGGDVLEREQR